MTLKGMLSADKLLHMAFAALLTAFFGSLLPLWAGACIALALGAAKELVWDLWMGRGTASGWDFLSDVAGVPAGLLIAWL